MGDKNIMWGTPEQIGIIWRSGGVMTRVLWSVWLQTMRTGHGSMPPATHSENTTRGRGSRRRTQETKINKKIQNKRLQHKPDPDTDINQHKWECDKTLVDVHVLQLLVLVLVVQFDHWWWSKKKKKWFLEMRPYSCGLETSFSITAAMSFTNSLNGYWIFIKWLHWCVMTTNIIIILLYMICSRIKMIDNSAVLKRGKSIVAPIQSSFPQSFLNLASKIHRLEEINPNDIWLVQLA